MSNFIKLDKENGYSDSGISNLNGYPFPVAGYAKALYFSMAAQAADHMGYLRKNDKTPLEIEDLCRFVGLHPEFKKQREIGEQAIAAIIHEGLFIKLDDGAYYLVRFNEMYGSYSDTSAAKKMRKYRANKSNGVLQGNQEQDGNIPLPVCNHSEAPSKPSLKNSRIKEHPQSLTPSGSGDNGVDDSFYKQAKDFFGQYPKQAHFDDVVVWFRKTKIDPQTYSAILIALSRDKDSIAWKNENGRFIPLPANWLNKSRWTAEDLKTAAILEEERAINKPKQNIPGTVPLNVAMPTPKQIPGEVKP